MQKENVTPGELQQAKALVLRQLSLAEPSEDAFWKALAGRPVGTARQFKAKPG